MKTRLTLTLILFVFLTSSYGQLWQKNYTIPGVNFHDLNIEKLEDGTNDLLVAGAIFDNTYANPEISLFRLDDATGNVVYQKTLTTNTTGVTNPRVFDVVRFEENGTEMIAITGSVEVNGWQNLAIIKVRVSDGTVITGAYYANMFMISTHTQGLHIIHTQLNGQPGFVVGGFANDDYLESTSDQHIGFVMRTDMNLASQWTTLINTPIFGANNDYDMVNHITETDDGFFVTGSCTGVPGWYTAGAVLATRLDAAGNMIWNNSYIMGNAMDMGVDAYYNAQSDEIYLLVNYSVSHYFGITVLDDNTGNIDPSRTWRAYDWNDLDKYAFSISKSETSDDNLVISGYDREAYWYDNNNLISGQTVPFMYEFNKLSGNQVGLSYLYHVPYTHPAGFNDYFNFFNGQLPLMFYPDIHVSSGVNNKNYFQVAYRNKAASGEVALEVIKTDNALLNACENSTQVFNHQTIQITPVDIQVYSEQPTKHNLAIQASSYGFEVDSCNTSVQVSDLDFGDAPEDATGAFNYPTTLANNGARHIYHPNIYLGSKVDIEADGQPSAGADCDDFDCVFPSAGDDEDGVAIPGYIFGGTTITMNVTASVSGFLDVWFDLNVDGDWTDAGEHIFTTLPVSGGLNPISYVVPTTVTLGPSYMRFRFRDYNSPISFDGQVQNGEVEDYLIYIEGTQSDLLDFGDAPDVPYPTLLAHDGARHLIDGITFMGYKIDDEPDGQPTINALGDDLNNLDDEDGVQFLNSITAGNIAKIDVLASVDGYLNTWIDFNKNGSWADAGEQIFINTPLFAGPNPLSFAVPASAKVGKTQIRFRFNTLGGLTYTGLAQNGEVEDYRVKIYPNWISIGTNDSHVIALLADWLPGDTLPIYPGDVVGVFYTNEQGEQACAGLLEIGEDQTGIMVAYGDDPFTPDIKEGFLQGETLTWKLFSFESEKVHDLSMEYDPAMPNSDGTFVSNGISAITQINGISVTATPEETSICAGSIIQMTALATGGSWDYTYNWTSNPPGFASNQMIAEAQPVKNTTYYVEVSDGLFTAIDSVVVNVSPAPMVDAGEDATICGTEPVLLSGVAENYSQTMWLTLEGNGIFDDETLLQTSYFPSEFDIVSGSVSLMLMAAPLEPCTIYAEDSMTLTFGDTQAILLKEGWQGISSYLSPDEKNIEPLMGGVNNLVIMYNYQGMYWPEWGVNTLGTWEDYSAYILKSSSEDTLYICGNRLESTDIQVDDTWNLVPVLCETQAPVEEVFAGLGGMVLVKAIGELGIFWPTFNVNTLGFLKSGKAYLGYASEGGSISYDGTCDAGAFKNGSAKTFAPEVETPWNKVELTPVTHTIAIVEEAVASLQNGDVIGAFTTNGRCAGIAVAGNGATALSLNGDDIQTPEGDGFTENEAISYKMYRPASGEVFKLEVEYIDELDHSGKFSANGMSAISSFKVSTTGISIAEPVDIKMYPNPSDGSISIDGISVNSNITINNSMGALVYNTNADNSIEINLSHLPKGVYAVRVSSEKGEFIEKLIIR